MAQIGKPQRVVFVPEPIEAPSFAPPVVQPADAPTIERELVPVRRVTPKQPAQASRL